jgi:hypothetical protein
MSLRRSGVYVLYEFHSKYKAEPCWGAFFGGAPVVFEDEGVFGPAMGVGVEFDCRRDKQAERGPYKQNFAEKSWDKR